MKWIIEKDKIYEEGKHDFKSNMHNFTKIYFLWGNNKCGFLNDGRFFFNNIVYDFKINIANIIPFQSKLCKFDFNTNKIISWNIGYFNNNEKYYVSIFNDNSIIFTAIKDDKKKVMKL